MCPPHGCRSDLRRARGEIDAGTRIDDLDRIGVVLDIGGIIGQADAIEQPGQAIRQHEAIAVNDHAGRIIAEENTGGALDVPFIIAPFETALPGQDTDLFAEPGIDRR